MHATKNLINKQQFINKNTIKDTISKYQAIFFDMDGTLVDTNQINYTLYRKILNKFNLIIDYQVWDNFFNGSTVDISLPKYLKSIDKILLSSEILVYFQKHGNKLKMELLNSGRVNILEPGHSLLKTAAAMDKKLILCTSSKRIFANYILNKLKLNAYFIAIITGDDIKNGKPNPDIYLKAKMIAMSNNCLIIEDSINGIKAAEKAKCDCILIKNKNLHLYKY